MSDKVSSITIPVIVKIYDRKEFEDFVFYSKVLSPIIIQGGTYHNAKKAYMTRLKNSVLKNENRFYIRIGSHAS